MVMRCPKCGNEISQDEVFCGQCGTPTTNLPPAQPIETGNAQAPRSGLLSSYNTLAAPPSSPYHPGMMPAPPNSYSGGTPPPPPNRPPTAGQLQPPLRQPGPQQPTDFYQDATEAISVSPFNSNQVYPQQGFAGTSMPGPGMYPGGGTYYGSQAQPFQTGNYAGYPQPQTLPSGQGYGMQGNFAPPPQKQNNSSILVIACVGLAVSLLLVTVIGVLYLQHSQSNQASNATPQASPTSVVTPTLVPSPTPTDTPTPVPTPSPTVAPTAAPDPGFTFCDQTCTSNGFAVEYPDGWQQNTPADGSSGAQFTNPSVQDQYAAFKVSDGTSATANDLINSDLKNNFASQSDYAPPTSSSSTTIGGVTWVYSTATYDLNGQTERVQVYATVHQTNSYIIELEAADSDFDTVNTKYFETMLGSLQFQQNI